MHYIIKHFKTYLGDKGYTGRYIERYSRALSIFLFRYHADIQSIRPFHLERFYQFLLRKQYPAKQIKEYHKSLHIFSLRKKLHRNDEVSS